MKQKSNTFYFTVICILFLAYAYIYEKFLASDTIVYNFYAEILSNKQADSIVDLREKWKLLNYLIIPILVLIRTNLVSLCMNLALFFYDTDHKIKYREIFRVALFGEFVFVLVGYFKFAYFSLFKTKFTLSEVQQFQPLSYTNFLDLNKIEPWLVYPLQTINAFEIGYFFILVYGLYKLLKNNYWKSFEMVAVSYGTGLTIWLGLIMFLTLNLS